MFSFTDIFCPSIEKQIEKAEGYLSIIYDARDQQECCVCERFCPDGHAELRGALSYLPGSKGSQAG